MVQDGAGWCRMGGFIWIFLVRIFCSLSSSWIDHTFAALRSRLCCRTISLHLWVRIDVASESACPAFRGAFLTFSVSRICFSKSIRKQFAIFFGVLSSPHLLLPPHFFTFFPTGEFSSTPKNHGSKWASVNTTGTATSNSLSTFFHNRSGGDGKF